MCNFLSKPEMCLELWSKFKLFFVYNIARLCTAYIQRFNIYMHLRVIFLMFDMVVIFFNLYY